MFFIKCPLPTISYDSLFFGSHIRQQGIAVLKGVTLITVLEDCPTLFAIDLCTTYYLSAVLKKFHIYHIIPILLPVGCTSLVQSLNVSISKSVKTCVQNLTNEGI